MREPGNTTAIPGFMTQLTVTGPFVNKTLFDQAGVKMPGDKATWEDWAKATKQVADKVQAPFPIAVDRSGHRFLGMAISEGAKLFDDKGNPAVDRRRLQARRGNGGRLARLRRNVEGAVGLGLGRDLSRRQ